MSQTLGGSVTEYSPSHREEQVPSDAYVRPGLKGTAKSPGRGGRTTNKRKKQDQTKSFSLKMSQQGQIPKHTQKSTDEKQPTKAIIVTLFHLEIKLILLNDLTKV